MVEFGVNNSTASTVRSKVTLTSKKMKKKTVVDERFNPMTYECRLYTVQYTVYKYVVNFTFVGVGNICNAWNSWVV